MTSLGALGVGVNAQEGLDAGRHDVVADGDSLLGHPFGSAAHDGNLRNVDAPVLGDIGSQDHHTGNIHAGAHVQDRRDIRPARRRASGLRRSSPWRLLGIHQTGLGGSLGGAAGDDQNDVVFQQLLHQLNVSGVGTNLGVVAADHGHSAAQNAGMHALDQRLGGAELVHLSSWRRRREPS